MAQLTPMLKQYFEIKKEHADSILLFRLGDFYEMFGQDAKEASAILDITLTARNKGTENEIPMCGVPFHALDAYLPKLTRAGKKAAICEQLSDPSLPGIVERKVVRIVTPGTTLDPNTLERRENNFLASLYKEADSWGLAVADLTTGEFKLAQPADINELRTIISRLFPAEAILPDALFNDRELMAFLGRLTNINKFSIPFHEDHRENILAHFKVKNLEGFGVDKMDSAIKAAANLLGYLKETQKSGLEHINRMGVYNIYDFMLMDEATLRNLELFRTSYDGRFEGSLLWAIDNTLTAMGGRLLRKWLLHPLAEKKTIEKRLEAVEEIKNGHDLSERLSGILKNTIDLERLLGRIGCGRANARDLDNLKETLKKVPDILNALASCPSRYLKILRKNLDECAEAVEIIERTIEDDPPALITEGGMIKKGIDKELDELKEIAFSGKDYIKALQIREAERSGISSLKVKFNKVFGYYIEISKANLRSVPDDYIRKQTLVNAERFITPELKEYEEKVLTAEERLKEIEQRIFLETVEKIKPYFPDIQKNARVMARLDILLSFAGSAGLHNYVRPEISDSGIIDIRDGRHPVIEMIGKEDYIPNDILLDHKANEFLLVTGPNMSGKSSYLRQTALIVLMAHIGSFVPASQARISIVDRIFTRVGASDDLNRGQSTFMVEMQEAANIINNATKKSLIILDELGRGTSTYDGVSIAWAIMEYIHHNIGAKTIFATHYHELVDVANKLKRAGNYCVLVKEDRGEVIFCRKVAKGAIDRSYGIEVAKLAGLPGELIDRARGYLEALEKKKGESLFPRQPALFGLSGEHDKKNNKYDKIIEELRAIDVNNITPVEAAGKLEELKKKYADQKTSPGHNQ